MALTSAGAAHAHEGASPHAVLVQREGGLYSLNLNFDAVRALHRTVQPRSAPAEFVAAHSAMSPEQFAQVWAAAVAAWSKDTALFAGTTTVPAARWQWPSAAAAQTLVREQLMHALTGHGAQNSDADAPHALAQARADFSVPSTHSRPGMGMKLHAALRPLSLTTYRPNQQWVGTGDAPIPLRF